VPSALGKLWLEPRRSLLRSWMLQVHKWAGAGAGLYLAMMGFTGGLSVFLPELRNTLVPPIHASVGQQRMTLQTLQASIESSHPTFRFRAVYPGQSVTGADTFEEQSDDTTAHEIVVNPYTAQMLIDRRKGATLYDWVRNLHANLLSGKTGKAVNGFGAILLLLTGLAGIVIWWPGRRHLKAKTFHVSARNGWHRLSFDLHRLVGVLAILPLSVAAITGVSLSLPRLAASVASAVLGPGTEPLRAKGDKVARQNVGVANTAVKSDRDQGGGKNDAVRHNFASLDDIVDVAKKQVPGATPTRIQSSAGKNSGYMVWMHLPSDWRDEGDNRVLIDGNSAMLLGVQLGRDRALSSRVIEGARALHYGQFGGVPTRVFAVLVGLTLPLLYTTGMALWWRRVSRQRPGAMVRAAPSVTPVGDDVYAFETQ
jgi:uncharacterized iron-regulated membrane protein